MGEYFHTEWVRGLCAQAVDGLRDELESAGKGVHFRLFEAYDLRDPDASPKVTYDELAGRFGMSATQVTNYLALARRGFRRLVLEQLRAVTGNERSPLG